MASRILATGTLAVAFAAILTTGHCPAKSPQHRFGADQTPVVEEVATGSAGERAGVIPGERVEAWRLEEEGIRRRWESGSPCSLERFQRESAPRGNAELRIRRAGTTRIVRLGPVAWGLRFRPALDGPGEEAHGRATGALRGGGIPGGRPDMVGSRGRTRETGEPRRRGVVLHSGRTGATRGR
jgi:hypothetical protein